MGTYRLGTTVVFMELMISRTTLCCSTETVRKNEIQDHLRVVELLGNEGP